MTDYLFALVCMFCGIGLQVAHETGDMRAAVLSIALLAIALVIRRIEGRE